MKTLVLMESELKEVKTNQKKIIVRHNTPEVESSRSPLPRGRPRGHIFKPFALVLASKPPVLGLGLEALGPRKLPCPRLEDSTTFLTVEILL